MTRSVAYLARALSRLCKDAGWSPARYNDLFLCVTIISKYVFFQCKTIESLAEMLNTYMADDVMHLSGKCLCLFTLILNK